ncbi:MULTISPECIES: outer membrane protein [Bradyrhizobium]|uniref:Porin family protein n=1 Tax=Bradyrhizobium aeschynomenes TaxID=2734909 RepID=A0ABX2CCX5_9BRAD|nr:MULTISPECIES: outer membrane beta-barrel protein [Bradyrhizobium]NPU15533.1 porin family protein [Bradyrhizobium aeschynomenes]NPU65142.1 porin family protein [Bradyrhizobium aeschynomenes]NPV24276.1 porin family protein [Bradyrhizobium aeschynomenes]
MKKILFATVALAALASAQSVLAADLGARNYPYAAKAPAYAAPIYNWTGFYLGAHLGGAFSSDNNFSGLATGNNSNGRFLGGVQVGADWQFAPTWVIGAEGQYSWLSGNVGAAFPGGFVYTNSQRGLGSITGRFGYTWGPGLLYVKGGYAYSDNNEKVTLAGVPVGFATNGDHRNGWTVGGGLEYMFAPNWSAKAEYQYYNFGSATFAAPAGLVPTGSFTTDDHTFKAGVNYRFNWGAPVAARY